MVWAAYGRAGLIETVSAVISALGPSDSAQDCAADE